MTESRPPLGDEESIPIGPEGSRCRHRFEGWVCTRPADHEGIHAAHGGDTEPLAVWNDDNPTHGLAPDVEALVIAAQAWRAGIAPSQVWDDDRTKSLAEAVDALDPTATALRAQPPGLMISVVDVLAIIDVIEERADREGFFIFPVASGIKFATLFIRRRIEKLTQ